MELKSLTEQKSLLATLPPGKRARLYRLLFEFGPGNGTLMLLPIDQGIEHGPRDFFPNPASKDPDYQFEASNVSARIDGDYIEFKLRPDYFGAAGFIYTLADAHGATSMAKVEISIAPVNDAPRDRDTYRWIRLGQDTVITVVEAPMMLVLVTMPDGATTTGAPSGAGAAGPG